MQKDTPGHRSPTKRYSLTSGIDRSRGAGSIFTIPYAICFGQSSNTATSTALSRSSSTVGTTTIFADGCCTRPIESCSPLNLFRVCVTSYRRQVALHHQDRNWNDTRMQLRSRPTLPPTHARAPASCLFTLPSEDAASATPHRRICVANPHRSVAARSIHPRGDVARDAGPAPDPSYASKMQDHGLDWEAARNGSRNRLALTRHMASSLAGARRAPRDRNVCPTQPVSDLLSRESLPAQHLSS